MNIISTEASLSEKPDFNEMKFYEAKIADDVTKDDIGMAYTSPY